MLSYIWPIALVVLANTFYQICAKATPEAMNPLASLTVTYTIAALAIRPALCCHHPGREPAAGVQSPELGPLRLWLSFGGTGSRLYLCI